LNDKVILVDDNDNMIGTMEKMQAHQSGKLHRAFSIFIFNTKGELLLQQRAYDKYHSGGKWTNTCCSHPAPGEANIDAANRRLNQEMGMQCELHHGFNFIYNAQLENDLSEHEFDHVFLGISDDKPKPNPNEVASFKYVQPSELAADLVTRPSQYSEWLKICFLKVMDYWQPIAQKRALLNKIPVKQANI
jgi:isopentenyl-diphosphate delta-isomerase